MTLPANETQRKWDSFDGYLCDIDGTLMRCTDLVHYTAFNRAMSEVAGKQITIDGVVTDGNVDLGILRDAFSLHGVAEQHWHPRRDWVVAEMGRYVTEYASSFQFNVLPGVRALLEHLKNRGAVLSTATGNFAEIGKAKLKQAGLLHLFDMGGWSDGCETRTEVFTRAAAAMHARIGSHSVLCVLGDTPADVRAARACGLSVIAVATGIYSLEDLQAQQPDYLVTSLTELLERTDTAATVET